MTRPVRLLIHGASGRMGQALLRLAADVQRYRARLSGPLVARVDLHVAVSAVPVRDLAARTDAERSCAVRERVERARAVQVGRYASLGLGCNGRVPGRWLERHTPVERDARERLAVAAERLWLSARAYYRVLRVARTIADLDGDAAVTVASVAEALRYRPAGGVATTAAVSSGAPPGGAASSDTASDGAGDDRASAGRAAHATFEA